MSAATIANQEVDTLQVEVSVKIKVVEKADKAVQTDGSIFYREIDWDSSDCSDMEVNESRENTVQ